MFQIKPTERRICIGHFSAAISFSDTRHPICQCYILLLANYVQFCGNGMLTRKTLYCVYCSSSGRSLGNIQSAVLFDPPCSYSHVDILLFSQFKIKLICFCGSFSLPKRNDFDMRPWAAQRTWPVHSNCSHNSVGQRRFLRCFFCFLH